LLERYCEGAVERVAPRQPKVVEVAAAICLHRCLRALLRGEHPLLLLEHCRRRRAAAGLLGRGGFVNGRQGRTRGL
jgi:hypothetical protein